MTEIEAKRKELMQKYEETKNMKNLDRGVGYLNQLEGFNLGVEMARKEDLDKINEQFSWFYGFKDNKRITIARLKRNLEELKQSLGEKTA